MMYTPGPWKIGKRGSVVGADNFEVCDPDQGPFLSEKFNSAKKHWGSTPGSHVERTDEEILANARLIAAAPAMFEAMKRHLEESGPREWSPRRKKPGGGSWQEEFARILRKIEEE